VSANQAPSTGASSPVYSSATVWPAEGARVALVTCLTCGSALLLSMAADAMKIHDEWHRLLASGDSAVSHD
jgi:hypothetical protein